MDIRFVNDICIIQISNVGKNEKLMFKCIEIIKHFSENNSEFFFGHYRTDGINLKSSVWTNYKTGIPSFFKENGRYKKLELNQGSKLNWFKTENYLTVGSLPLNIKTLEILPIVFHFYLETIFFCPKKINFEEFETLFMNYMKLEIGEFVRKKYTDFIFSYADSGEFSMLFSVFQHEKNQIINVVEEILKTNT